MKNAGLLRRFILGSLILGVTIPMTYHIALNYVRNEHFAGLTKQLCKAVEPRIQIGAYREALETVQGAAKSQGLEISPDVVFVENGNTVTPLKLDPRNSLTETCEFQGISGVSLSINYAGAPLANPKYLYLYLISVPIIFLLFMFARLGIIRLQKKAADRIESQMKALLGMNQDPPRRTSLIDKAFDLELPLVRYLKSHIETLQQGLDSYARKVAEQEKREVLTDVAAQVAHDIVSPITMLQKILGEKESDRNEALIKSELARIKALSEKLLAEYRGSAAETGELFNLHGAIRLALEEVGAIAHKKGAVEIDFQSSLKASSEVLGNFGEFVSAISNILKNSLEALDKERRVVQVSLNQSAEGAELKVSDNGCGIDPKNLEKIFEKGMTFGKTKGTGLGLFQVRNTIRSFNGRLALESEPGQGTIVTIYLPLVPAEDRKVEVSLNKTTQLVFLDDDNLIHQTWKIVLEGISLPEGMPEPLHFTSIGSFREWFATGSKGNTVFFIDFNLDKKDETGFDVIQELGIQAQSYLLTGAVFDRKFLAHAKVSGVRVLDKGANDQIIFHAVDGSVRQPDLVLIDDSRANRLVWEIEAKKEGKLVEAFGSGAAFLKECSSYSRQTPIFVDYYFEDEAEDGGQIAETLLNRGFRRVFIATAFPASSIKVPFGVAGVVGKDFPSTLISGI